MDPLKRVTPLFYLAIILLNFTHNTYASTTQDFPVPPDIANANIQEVRDADAILTSAQFRQTLHKFANGLTPEEIAQQSLFNKIALLSLRSDVQTINKIADQQHAPYTYAHYQFYHQSVLALQAAPETDFNHIAASVIETELAKLDDKQFVKMNMALGWSVSNARTYVFNLFKQAQQESSLSKDELLNIAVNCQLYYVLAHIIPVANAVITQQQHRRFIIEPNTVVNLDSDLTLSTTIVRRRDQSNAASTALQYTIYADESAHIKTAMSAAAHGYIGIVANSRGKRSSKNRVVPWEHEGEDAAKLIKWIAKQNWSNGKVVMYGGSYNGFTQWAAAKHMPKALKAIAPYVAANLITGLPYENNIALTGNFEWPIYAASNSTLDDSVYSDWQRTNDIVDTLYTSGRPIVDIDKLAGRPSPWLQKWLAHPQSDSYYQAMVPYQTDYQRINIPVLTITGYFEGGQISALDYFYEHYKYNNNADHALLIGPYNHWTAQNVPRSHHSNYALDPVALKKDTEDLVFRWFDHVLENKPKPELVQNTVNYQLMGANEWRFADSIDLLNKQHIPFFIQPREPNEVQPYKLGRQLSRHAGRYLEQIVDMSDRTEQRNLAPWPIIQDTLDTQGGIHIETPVFEQDMELTGSITGFFDIAVNKRDVDIGFNYYHILPDGRVFHLNNYRSRASHADSNESRKLLEPDQLTRVPIVNARFTSKLIPKGSKIALVLNVNKNRDAQVNLGTGGPVNHEHISQAGAPLKLRWYLSSQINLPLKPYTEQPKS